VAERALVGVEQSVEVGVGEHGDGHGVGLVARRVGERPEEQQCPDSREAVW
jgi:hypothetical protein